LTRRVDWSSVALTKESGMARSKPRLAESNAGAFYTPDVGGGGLIPVPMRTLSDDYHDEPTEPADDREPEPEPLSLIGRIVERLRRRPLLGH
jgi:hypothetical protein